MLIIINLGYFLSKFSVNKYFFLKLINIIIINLLINKNINNYTFRI